MADILPTLLSFPRNETPAKKKPSPKEYDSQITAFIKELGKIKDVSFTKTVEKKNLLDMLDLSINSLAYLTTLSHQIIAAGKDTRRKEALISTYAIPFLLQFDPIQVRYDGETWRYMFEYVNEVLCSNRSTDLSPLSTAILRLDPSAGTFTTNHVRLLRAALSNGVPSQALPILDQNIHAYPHKSSKRLAEELLSEEHEFSNAYISQATAFSLEVKSEHVLEYYFLGASIYLALNNYTRARLFLEHVLLSPLQSKSGSFSALQVEACRKWVLLGLLVQGKQFPFPATMDGGVVQKIRNVAGPYEALAADFEKRDLKKFEAEMDLHGKNWADDGNLRLVREVGNALVRYKVIDLQKTYAALPVTRVAELMEMDTNPTFQLLQDMIGSGALLAELSQSGVLTFKSSEAKLPEVVDGPDDLEARTRRITDLIASVREADRRLQLTKEFVDVAKRQKKAGSGVDGDLADVMDLEYDNPSPAFEPMERSGEGDDEDLMV